MIRSIEKVRVIEVTPIQPLTREAARAIIHPSGVYMLFSRIRNKDPFDFRFRDYCKIGRARGILKARLLGNIRHHENPDNDCGPLEGHLFQVLACENGIDAARLESLFHLWHQGHAGKGQTPLEPRGIPSTKEEPDFFYLTPKH